MRPDRTTPGTYAIRVQGRLDARWAGLLDGCTLRHDRDGTTVLTREVLDQAALHGVLQVLRDLGLPLLSVTPVDPSTGGAPPTGSPPTSSPPPAPPAAADAAAPSSSRSTP